MSERPTPIVGQVHDANLDLLEAVRKCRDVMISMTGGHHGSKAAMVWLPTGDAGIDDQARTRAILLREGAAHDPTRLVPVCSGGLGRRGGGRANQRIGGSSM